MPLAAGTRRVSVRPATPNSTPVRPALCLLSQRKPVYSGSQQRGCQVAGRGPVYPAGPREAPALRPGSGGCWEECHLTQGGRQQTMGEPEAARPAQAGKRQNRLAAVVVRLSGIECCAVEASRRQLLKAPWSCSATRKPPSLPSILLLIQARGCRQPAPDYPASPGTRCLNSTCILQIEAQPRGSQVSSFP